MVCTYHSERIVLNKWQTLAGSSRSSGVVYLRCSPARIRARVPARPAMKRPWPLGCHSLVPIPPRLTVSSLGALLSVFFYRTNFLSTR